MNPSNLLSRPRSQPRGTFPIPLCSFALSSRTHRSSRVPRPPSFPLPALTQPHLAGVGQVVVAGNITPLSLIVPHHNHAVLSGQEVAVWLPRVPVLIELGGRGEDGGGSEELRHQEHGEEWACA